jgi:hypothetical protein
MTVVRNEFESGENSPFRVLLERVQSAAYVWHGYGKSPIGSRSDIENVPIERLQAFYRRHYQPDNAVLIVAGRFDERPTLELIASKFGAIPRPERELTDHYTVEPVQDGEREVVVRRVGDLQILLATYHVPAGAHPDFVPSEKRGGPRDGRRGARRPCSSCSRRAVSSRPRTSASGSRRNAASAGSSGGSRQRLPVPTSRSSSPSPERRACPRRRMPRDPAPIYTCTPAWRPEPASRPC